VVRSGICTTPVRGVVFVRVLTSHTSPQVHPSPCLTPWNHVLACDGPVDFHLSSHPESSMRHSRRNLSSRRNASPATRGTFLVLVAILVSVLTYLTLSLLS
jgi:hypothetical protein